MARCLVIGGNGFLGAPLVDALVQAGHTVTAFDRFSRGIANFESVDARRQVGDFLNISDLRLAIADHDVIFHFLSTTTPATAENEPSLDIRTNLSQSVAILEIAAQHSVQRFFFASSGGAIYGPQSRASYSETTSLKPVSPYGIGKMAVESYLKYFEMKHELRSVALRISNPYGPGQSPQKRQGLIPIALNSIRAGRPVVRLGDGTMVRDYIYVNSLVERIVRMLAQPPRHDVYNLGSGVGHSVNEVFATIGKVTGVRFDVEERAKPATFVDEVVLDTARYRDEYGDPPSLSLEEGIRRTWHEMNR